MSATPVMPLVSCQWVREQQLQHGPALRIIDASWYLPVMERNGKAEYDTRRIPSAAFFDIDATDEPSDLPHMLPSAQYFARAMEACGVTNEDHVVVYDGKGIFSAPRLWWMLRAFGHERVSVLDGGLPAWTAAEYPLETSTVTAQPAATGSFKASLEDGAACSSSQLLAHVVAPSSTVPLVVVDARPAARFEGSAPEPRKGCRSGHIPRSLNVPFGSLLTEEGMMRPADELRSVFMRAGVPIEESGPSLVTSCGSGVTAAVVQLALAHLGRSERVSLYDGSWAEWGSDESMPLESGPPVIGS